MPPKRRGPNRQYMFVALHVRAAALGHRPPPAALGVQCDIDGAVIERIAAARPGVVGRKNAADEGDQRDRRAAIVADSVEVPPDIATGRDFHVEARSETRRRAASCPDSAAIGTPAPGCTLPPAR